MKKLTKSIFLVLAATIIVLSTTFHKRIMLTYGLLENFLPLKNNIAMASAVNINTSSTSMNYKDVLYKSTNGVDLHLDIYSPTAKKYNKSPVILYVHGGCWAYGDKSIPNALDPFLEPFRKQGYTIISVEYELMRNTENFNKQICDVKDAIRWIYKNSDVYNMDSSEIGIIGISSGAHISMLASYSHNNDFIDDPQLKDYPSKVKYIIDLFGPTDLKLLNKDNLNYDLNKIFSSIQNFDETSSKYNPINYITKDIPNTFIVHGKNDDMVPYKSSTELYKKCQEVHAKSDIVILQSSTHDLSGITKDDASTFSFKLAKFIILNSPA